MINIRTAGFSQTGVTDSSFAGRISGKYLISRGVIRFTALTFPGFLLQSKPGRTAYASIVLSIMNHFFPQLDLRFKIINAFKQAVLFEKLRLNKFEYPGLFIKHIIARQAATAAYNRYFKSIVQAAHAILDPVPLRSLHRVLPEKAERQNENRQIPEGAIDLKIPVILAPNHRGRGESGRCLIRSKTAGDSIFIRQGLSRIKPGRDPIRSATAIYAKPFPGSTREVVSKTSPLSLPQSRKLSGGGDPSENKESFPPRPVARKDRTSRNDGLTNRVITNNRIGNTFNKRRPYGLLHMDAKISSPGGYASVHYEYKYRSPFVFHKAISVNSDQRKNASSSSPRKDTPGDESLYFHTRHNLQTAYNEIGMSSEKTHETLNRLLHPDYFQNNIERTVKRHIDVDRISEQVYRNIERKIKAERERKGLS